MSRCPRSARWLLPALGMLLLPLGGCTGGASSPASGGASSPSAVATVNGDVIGRADFDKQLELRRGPEILDRLVMEKLIEQEAKKQNVVIPDAELKARLDELHKDAHYKETIRQGATPELLDDEMRISMLLKQLMLKEITEQDKLRFYDRFKDDLTQVKVAQILLTDRKEAERVRDDLTHGADFGAEARKFSKDPASRDQDGVIGYFIRSQLEPPFTKVAFDTPVGQISPIVQSQFGYHIVKVLDKKSTYDQLKSAVEDQLLASQLKQYEDRLRAKATIVSIYDKDRSAAPGAASPSAAVPTTAGSSPDASHS